MLNQIVKTVSIHFFLLPLLLAGLVSCESAPPPGESPQPSAEAVKARWYNNQGVVYMDQHNYIKGRDNFLESTSLDSTYANGFANLGISFYSLGEFEQSQAALERALEIDPRHLHAHYTLGLIFQGQAYERARTSFETVRSAAPEEPLVHYYLGQVYGKLGMSAEAEASLRETIRLDPSNVSAHYSLAQHYRKQGDMDRFKAFLEDFTRLQKAGYQSVSQSYQGQGKFAEAEADAGYSDPSRDDSGGPFSFAAGPGSPASWAASADWDGDGDPDLLVGASGAALRRNEDGALTEAVGLAIGSGEWSGGLAADFDNDGQTDLVLSGPEGGAVWLQTEEGFKHHATLPPAQRAVGGDLDHDGDLDLLLLGDDGLLLLGNDGGGAFEDRTAAAQVTVEGPVKDAVFSDFDNDRDVDIFVLGDSGLQLYSNQRDGTFAEIAGQVGLGGTRGIALAVEDLDQDGLMDLCLASGKDLNVWRNGGGVFEASTSRPLPGGIRGLRAADFDNDGDMDLAAHGDGLHILAWQGGTFTKGAAVTAEQVDGPLLVADWDGDGDADLHDGARLWTNGSAGGTWIKLALQGLNSNRDGAGTKVEVKTTYRLQKRELRADGVGGDLTFGLGQADSVEFIRLLWPGGVRQTELATAAGQTIELTELDRKGTSCPILYAWDGERFRFVTDILGGAIVGYLTAPGQYGSTDTDEYVSLGTVAPLNGRYTLQIANQLEEIIYIDAAELVAVDHPVGTEVYPNERLLSGPPYPDEKYYPLSALRPPVAATDDRGNDILPHLTRRDDDWHDNFALLDIHGYAEEHSIVLDLGDLEGIDRPVLLGYGWVDYAHSTSNWAAAQRGLSLRPNSLEVGDGRGGWRTVTADMGTPAGLPKFMLYDLGGLLTPGDHRLRITTNAAVYWDQFLVGQADTRSVKIHRQSAATADLHWRGYPEHTSIKGTFAFRYHYDRLQTEAPWGTHAGAFTKFGEVSPLLEAPDNRYVIMFHGDELTVEFDANALPPPGAGMERSFLLYANGFGKDMDYHSAHSLTVDPLPYHGMPSYPYPSDAPYPQTAENMDYMLEYNTRHIRGYYR